MTILYLAYDNYTFGILHCNSIAGEGAVQGGRDSLETQTISSERRGEGVQLQCSDAIALIMIAQTQSSVVGPGAAMFTRSTRGCGTMDAPSLVLEGSLSTKLS